MTYEVIIETDGRRPDADAARKVRAFAERLGRTYGLRIVKLTPTGPSRPVHPQESDRVRSN